MTRPFENARCGGHPVEQGFTLIEIMVVVVILGLLATIVAQNVFGETDRARLQRAKADISTIEEACERYRLHHNGRWPEDLNELVRSDDGSEPYLKGDEVPQGPWGSEYHMERDGSRVLIICDGPDTQPDTEDDITSKNKNKITVEDLRRLRENK